MLVTKQVSSLRLSALSDISYPRLVEHTITRVISGPTGYKMFNKIFVVSNLDLCEEQGGH